MFNPNVYPRHSIQLGRETLCSAVRMLVRGQGDDGVVVAKFEECFAGYLGVPQAFGVSSARHGLALIIKTLGWDEGDEILVPAYTFQAIPETVVACGLRPVFVDVCAETYNIDPALIAKRITSMTRAIIVTHMFGQPCDMDRILDIAQRRGLFVIEDCAHACGASYKAKKVGGLGDAAVFSFNKGKNLPCFGGGMVTVRNAAIGSRIHGAVRELPFPPRGKLAKEILSTCLAAGMTQQKIFPCLTYPAIRLFDFLGVDWIDRQLEEKIDIEKYRQGLQKQYRLADLQAAAGLAQIMQLDTQNAFRRKNAELFIERLQGVEGISLQGSLPETQSTHLYLHVRTAGPDPLRKKLLARGVDTKRDDMRDCSGIAAFADGGSTCPVASKLPPENLEIPNSLWMQAEDVLYITEQIKRVAAEMGRVP